MNLTASDTQRLTRARFEVKAGSRLRRPRILAVAVLCLGLAGYAGLYFGAALLAGSSSNAELRAENIELSDRLAQAELELAVERAAHAELERQVTSLQGEVSDLDQQLEFLTARSAAR